MEVRVKTWQERLFEFIRLADGFVACKGGTGTLAELAVAWEMMNKSVIGAKPFVALGDFWQPILKCVREVETGQKNPWAEANARIVCTARDGGRSGGDFSERVVAEKVRREWPDRHKTFWNSTSCWNCCGRGRRVRREKDLWMGCSRGRSGAALTAAFALIREAREWLRAARELGFGGLADPESWLERIEGPGMVLEARELLDAATLLEISGWLRQQFREEETKFPLLAARAGALSDFQDALTIIRRSILPNGEISDDASPALRRIRAQHHANARGDSENPEAYPAHTRTPRRAKTTSRCATTVL